MRNYIVWLRNTTNIRDDEPLKIRARSEEEAKKVALGHLRGRFLIREVYTLKKFKKIEPWWHSVLWGTKPVNE